MCCPQPHRPITLVTLLTKETRRYSETQVPIYQRTWRRILEDKSFPVSGTVLNAARSKACGAVCCSNNINIYIYIYKYISVYICIMYICIYRCKLYNSQIFLSSPLVKMDILLQDYSSINRQVTIQSQSVIVDFSKVFRFRK